MPPLAMPTSIAELTGWLEASREWERARVLREESRLAVARARALCAEIAALAANWRHRLPASARALGGARQ